MRTAADVMTTDPLTVAPSDTFESCAESMRFMDIRHLVVTNATGTLAGLVGDAAVFEHGRFAGDRWVPSRPEFDGASIASVVRPVDAIDPGTSLKELLTRLLDGDEDVLVIVDKANVPIGIFTEFDALALASRELPPELRVSAVMASSLVTVEPETPLGEAWALLEEHGIRHLPIRDGARLEGVLSARDLLMVGASVVAGGTVGQMIRSERPLYTIGPKASVREAASLMCAHKIGCLPVMEGASLEGLVTATDPIRALLRTLS